jgi:lysophospholipase L1-like esterase
LGDSITNQAFAQTATWRTAWATGYPEGAPRLVNRGLDGDTAGGGLARMDAALEGITGVRYLGIAFGTNDCRLKVPVATYQDQLRQLVGAVRGRGITPLLCTIPSSASGRIAGLQPYQDAVVAVRQELDVLPGPDLNGWSTAHPELYVADAIHFTGAGSQEIVKLWAGVLQAAVFGT